MINKKIDYITVFSKLNIEIMDSKDLESVITQIWKSPLKKQGSNRMRAIISNFFAELQSREDYKQEFSIDLLKTLKTEEGFRRLMGLLICLTGFKIKEPQFMEAIKKALIEMLVEKNQQEYVIIRLSPIIHAFRNVGLADKEFTERIEAAMIPNLDLLPQSQILNLLQESSGSYLLSCLATPSSPPAPSTQLLTLLSHLQVISSSLNYNPKNSISLSKTYLSLSLLPSEANVSSLRCFLPSLHAATSSLILSRYHTSSGPSSEYLSLLCSPGTSSLVYRGLSWAPPAHSGLEAEVREAIGEGLVQWAVKGVLGVYEIDALVIKGGKKVVVECRGPSHYVYTQHSQNSQQHQQHQQLAPQHLEWDVRKAHLLRGWGVSEIVEVGWKEWMEVGGKEEKRKWIWDRLNKAGISEHE